MGTFMYISIKEAHMLYKKIKYQNNCNFILKISNIKTTEWLFFLAKDVPKKKKSIFSTIFFSQVKNKVVTQITVK